MTTISELFGSNAKNNQPSRVEETRSTRINPKTNRPYEKAKVWLNIGIEIDVPNEEGEIVKRFIPIPNGGIALDTADPLETKASDTAEWVEEVRMRNLLLQVLKGETTTDKLAPGQTAMLNIPLKAQVRRVPEAAAETPIGESPALSALAKALGLAA